jgi:selenocysteine lyase/cysteine desulfurase
MMNLIEQFPIINTSTYLNTASSGILSKSLLDWRREHDLNYFHHGSEFRIHQKIFLTEVRTTLAKFFSADPNNTFLLPNFSFGFNTFLEGLSGCHKFLLVKDDYPSINYAVKSRGFDHTYVPAGEQFEALIFDHIKTFKPTIFAFSIVQYISGIKINMEFLKTLKIEFPDLLLVADGTQFCGTEDFNFEDSGLDVLISSGYKWMLAGYGNGFLFFKDHVKEFLYEDAKKTASPHEPFLLHKSWLSIYFEPGHQDTLAFGSLQHSILNFDKIGMDFIENQITDLSKKAKSAFVSRGLLDHEMASRDNHSSIFNLNVPESIYDKLQAANILTTFRGKGIRVAFNYYNSEQDLQHLLEVIDLNR